MLDTSTKRRIDTARDILVGKVPDPKSQVEQITIALIYKFMDDMDAESEELGGKRKFFAGEYGRYGWARLMRSGLGGHETLNLYAEAIAKMPENPGIPPLFRDIFKNAFLPYRDPETLRMFLKVIDEFEYDHSERLGDAFEYLLSVLGSQGDAGQFRTPRHIIDFIVAIIDPKKTDTVLDPACGTAGFLISSFKHILKTNTDADGNSTLTPDERGRLAANFKGYDISPDMVRLSLVNMYLHGFTDPHIVEYDTLSREDRWNECADVILANPPFMSPKGGIRPHNRFSVQSKRSEVLFVDYMAEHLKPGGRAGIIVPEGVIFQSQTAYTQLRRMLVEDCLVAVVSLPAGVFNPYSGVKTSILILDKALAKQTSSIAFLKIENDGFNLGAQRRPIDKDNLPQARAEIAEYLRRLRARESVEGLELTLGLVVPKDRIAGNGDYNLYGERYREGAANNHSFPLVSLGDSNLFRVEGGGTPKSDIEEYWGGGIPWATLADLPPSDFISHITMTQRTISEKGLRESSAKLIPANSVIVSTRATIGRIAINRAPIATNQGFKSVVIEDAQRAMPEYVALALTKLVPTMKAWATGGTFAEISKSKFCELQIPLPPLQVQSEIVAEIEGYQKVIDGARAVLDNYRPHIPINPDWPLVELASVVRFQEGPGILAKDFRKDGIPLVRLAGLGGATVTLDGGNYLDPETVAQKWNHFRLQIGDILVSTSASFGRPAIVTSQAEGAVFYTGLIRFRPLDTRLDAKYLETFLGSPAFLDQGEALATGSSIRHFGPMHLKQMKIPLPSVDTQRAIVAELEAEQALVNANRELIARMEQKVQATLARVWCEDKPAAAEA
ncbi:MAG: restriction endonuclease subunit M/S [Acidobacteria bacterium]|nr:MAG: restriction endonuclease subunit M/S [Acidobacteriota bacterium]